MTSNPLKSILEFPVRFSEVDSMQIVWHGHYVKYMEEGREDFGRKYGISYMIIKANGYLAPLVALNVVHACGLAIAYQWTGWRLLAGRP